MVEARFGTGTSPRRSSRPSRGGRSGPVASAYGYHLVLVTSRAPARVPDFAEVAGRIATDLDAARRAGALDRIYANVRDAYQVEIEPNAASTPDPPHLHDHADDHQGRAEGGIGRRERRADEQGKPDVAHPGHDERGQRAQADGQRQPDAQQPQA